MYFVVTDPCQNSLSVIFFCKTDRAKTHFPRKNLMELSENMTWKTWKSHGISCHQSPKNPDLE